MSKAAAIRLIALALAAAGALVVFGCGGGSATETASTSSSSSPSNPAEGGGAKEQQGPASAQKPKTASETGEGSGSAKATAKGTGDPSSAAKPEPGISPPKRGREPETSEKERAEATVASMTLTSPALAPGPESVSALPPTYTCQGKDTWPSLHWTGVPPASAELVLFAINLEPIDEALFFDWAVAGLDPGLTEIKSGALPAGAVIGKNGFGKEGYSICPPKSPETVIFALYALPERLSAKQGFDPATLRREVLDASGNAGLLATSYSHG